MDAGQLIFDAIGTKWQITIENPSPGLDQMALERGISDRIELFDKAYSRFRADSLVTSLAQSAGTYDLPADAYPLLQWYEQLYEATSGKVTPLIGQVMADAGYDADYSLQPQPLTTPPAWQDVLEYSQTTITMLHPALLDFGAAGKGYLVDIIAELLDNCGVAAYVIDAGGDIRQKGEPATKLEVGLQHPQQLDEAIGIATISNQAICGSAGNRRQWAGFTHIIDPDKLTSPRDIIATWVVANDAITADGLATALSFSEPAKLAERFHFDYAIVRSDMSLEYSREFPATFYKASI